MNFTNNNIIATYEPKYGEIPLDGYLVNVAIPAFPDISRKFNEFYLDFIVLDGLKLSTRFYIYTDRLYRIFDLPEVLTANHTFHFKEDSVGNYVVDWKQNYDA